MTKLIETIYYDWCEEGGAEIEVYENKVSLYLVPMYGGEPDFIGDFETIDLAKSYYDENF